ncbi:MAG: sortase [Propionibacteriaceae bacterium]|nr:sortase [Propionibacteriaceae bacterium]
MNPPRRTRIPVVLAVVLLVGLLAGGGVVAWQVWGTVAPARERAAREVAAIRQGWEQGGAAPAGEAAWILHIPALGEQEWPIRAGVAEAQLDGGFGWYPGTAEPGEVGNFAVAGRWLTGGEPLRGWFELPVGSQVRVETATEVLTYELTLAPGGLTVGRDEAWVLEPVPGRGDETATQAWLTITTNEDFFPGPEVAVAFGKLTDKEMK